MHKQLLPYRGGALAEGPQQQRLQADGIVSDD